MEFITTKNVEWSIVLENFFKDMGEKAYCYSWLHKKCEARFSRKRNYTDLPIIVLSTISGTLSIGSSSIFPEKYAKEGNMGIGIVSLFVAILNVVGTYFDFAKRAETHRLVSIEYSKLYRFLDIELSLPRHERMIPVNLLKMSRDHYERLDTISPIIPAKIIKDFKRKFKNINVSKPSETNGLENIQIYKPDKDIICRTTITPDITQNTNNIRKIMETIENIQKLQELQELYGIQNTQDSRDINHINIDVEQNIVDDVEQNIVDDVEEDGVHDIVENLIEDVVDDIVENDLKNTNLFQII
jgi:hypothetical protein